MSYFVAPKTAALCESIYWFLFFTKSRRGVEPNLGQPPRPQENWERLSFEGYRGFEFLQTEGGRGWLPDA